MKTAKKFNKLSMAAIMLCCFFIFSFVFSQAVLAQDEAASADSAGDSADAVGEESVSPAASQDEETPENVIEATGEVIDEETAAEAVAAAEQDQAVTAEDLDVKDPRILPGNPLYGLKNLWRGARLAFTFNKVKKAEKRMQYANERLVEAQKLAEEADDEKAQEHIEKAMERYEKDLEKVDKVINKIKDKVEDNPRLEKFFDKVADYEIKKQKVLQNIQDKVPEKVMEKVMEAKEKSAKHFGQVVYKIASKEKIADKLGEVMDRQEGSEFKHFKNLEILNIIEDHVPEEAREAIKRAEEHAKRRFEEEMKMITDKKKHVMKMKKYLEKAKGDPLHSLEVLDDLKNNADIPEEMLKDMEIMKDQAIRKFEKHFKKIKMDDIKERFFKPFKDGDVVGMRVMRQLQDKVAPEMKKIIEKEHEESIQAFKAKFSDDPNAQKTADKFRELTKKMEENPDPVTFQMIKDLEKSLSPEQRKFVRELEKRAEKRFSDNFQEMDDKFMERMSSDNPEHIEIMKNMRDFMPPEAMQGMEKMIRHQIDNIDRRMEMMPSPEEMLDFRRRFEEDDGIREEILRFEPMFMKDVNARQIEKIKDKLERFDDPDKMLKFREQFEKKIEQAPGFRKQILQGQPDLFRQFDEKQLEVMKKKMHEMGDPDRIMDFRKRIEDSFDRFGDTGREILENRPDFFMDIDNEHLKAVEDRMRDIEDPEKILEFRERIDRRFEENPEFKERILENRPDFLKRIDREQINIIEDRMDRFEDSDKALEFKRKVDRRFEENPEFKERILENRPDFMERIDKRHVENLEERIKKEAPEKMEAAEKEIRRFKPEFKRSEILPRRQQEVKEQIKEGAEPGASGIRHDIKERIDERQEEQREIIKNRIDSRTAPDSAQINRRIPNPQDVQQNFRQDARQETRQRIINDIQRSAPAQNRIGEIKEPVPIGSQTAPDVMR